MARHTRKRAMKGAPREVTCCRLTYARRREKRSILLTVIVRAPHIVIRPPAPARRAMRRRRIRRSTVRWPFARRRTRFCHKIAMSRFAAATGWRACASHAPSCCSRASVVYATLTPTTTKLSTHQTARRDDMMPRDVRAIRLARARARQRWYARTKITSILPGYATLRALLLPRGVAGMRQERARHALRRCGGADDMASVLRQHVIMPAPRVNMKRVVAKAKRYLARSIAR